MAALDPDPFAVRAGNADQPGEVRLSHAEELRLFPAHHVGPIGPRLGDTGQDADVAGRIDADSAFMQRLKTRRRLQIGSFNPALPRAGHATDQHG
jgi:hypothetical protein